MRKLIFMLLAGVFLLSTGLRAKPSEKHPSETYSVTGKCHLYASTELKSSEVFVYTFNSEPTAKAEAITDDGNVFNKDAELPYNYRLIHSWSWETVGWRQQNVQNSSSGKFNKMIIPPSYTEKTLSWTVFASTMASWCV